MTVQCRTYVDQNFIGAELLETQMDALGYAVRMIDKITGSLANFTQHELPNGLAYTETSGLLLAKVIIECLRY
jgi:hypothetical protein